jgi:hypothetical protein
VQIELHGTARNRGRHAPETRKEASQVVVKRWSGLVLNLVEHQREIAAIGKQPFFRKVGSLWTPEVPVAAERPFAERLNCPERHSERMKLRIEVSILALCKN